MEDFFICPRCGNSNLAKTGIKEGVRYCRACLSFNGSYAPVVKHKKLDIPIRINYELTSEQARIAEEIDENYQNGINTLVYAVCGAGKTELVFKVIQSVLKTGKQIGFTVPRKEVVIELSTRIKDAFPQAKVISVFGGHNDVLTGNIVVLTTHQLYRYQNYFDLLVFDEIDAFPYKGDLVLESFFQKSVKGVYVLLSATPSKKILSEFSKKGSVLTLFTRFHNNQIPVPRVSRGYGVTNFMILIKELFNFIKRKKPVLIFVPTINKAIFIYRLLKIDFKTGNIVHSKVKNNSEVIADFKKGKYEFLVTTTDLERGVTIKGLQVIIYGADHAVYDSSSLIQIAGRVGRKKEESDGEVVFIVSRENQAIKESIRDIKEKNTYLQTVLREESGGTV